MVKFYPLYCFALICLVGVATSQVFVVQTAKDTGDRLTPQQPLQWSPKPAPASTNILIDNSVTFQTITGTILLSPTADKLPQDVDNLHLSLGVVCSILWPDAGFGGAFTEAGAYVFSQLKPELQDEVIEAYFGKTGNHYSVCRTHIASCDFSLDSYTYAPVENDWQLQNFTIERDHKYLLPFIKAAWNKTELPIRLFATPWTAPAWMKWNNNLNGSASPTGLLPSPMIHKTYAQYISKYISAYRNEGIEMWGITIQNEPEFAAPWEATCYTANDMLAHLRDYLHPVMSRDHPEVKIMIYDHNKDNLVNWVETIFGDPIVRNMAHGTAVHWYNAEPGQMSDRLSKANEIAPDKFILPTEACNCPGVILGDWPRGETYGIDIIADLNNWAVGWVDWNMLLDMKGGPNHLNNYCDAPIVGDAVNQKVHLQPPYWYMGHFSRYVLPGYKRIASKSSNPSSPLLVSAFSDGETGQQIVVVVMNPTDNPADFTLSDSGSNAYYNMPAHSIVTLSYLSE